MTRVKVLALLTALALLAALPAVALAQEVPPHVFIGTVTTQAGSPAADGTAVTAWVDGEQRASTTVSGGRYVIQVGQPEGASFTGQTVSFRIGEASATQTGTWEQGGGTELNLTAGAGPAPGGTPVATALAALTNLEIASAFNYDTGRYQAYVPGQANNPLSEIQPNSVIVLTLTEDTTVMVSGVSFTVMADTPTPLPVGSNVSITVQ